MGAEKKVLIQTPRSTPRKFDKKLTFHASIGFIIVDTYYSMFFHVIKRREKWQEFYARMTFSNNLISRRICLRLSDKNLTWMKIDIILNDTSKREETYS